MPSIKRMILTAMLIGAGVVLPVVFHAIAAGFGGRVLLPMHIPVLVAGLIVGPVYGFFAGLVTPLISSMTTGMPVAGPTLYRMMAELAVYGGVAGILMHIVRTKRLVLDLYISLIGAMVLGRVVAGIVGALLLFGGEVFSFGIWVASYFTASLPGIAVQLVVVPIIIIALERARLIPRRYPNDKVILK